MNAEVLNLPIGIQVALGSGYLAYVTAYAGLRRGHGPADTAFISLAFGLVGMVVFDRTGSLSIWQSVALAVLAAVATGAIWRVWGARMWHRIVHGLRIHADDGTATAWDALIHKAGQTVQQVSVHTKDGRVLYLNDRHPYVLGPHRGLILGGNGDIVLVVEEERIPGTEGDEVRDGIVTRNGTRLTYIPAAEIARINMRVK